MGVCHVVVCECFTRMSHVCARVSGGQERVLALLGLELQVVVSHCVVLRTEPTASVRVSSTLN